MSGWWRRLNNTRLWMGVSLSLSYFVMVSHHVAIKGCLNHDLLFLEGGAFLKPKILSAKGAIGFKDAPVDH